MRAKDIERALQHLNTKTDKKFRAAGKNKTLITSLLKDFTVSDIKSVIDAKCTEWTGDPKMEKYLRPQTLFNRSKFQSYFEQINPVKDKSLTPRQREHREYIKTPKWLSKREKVMHRSTNHTCEGCGVYLGVSGHVHHLTYDNFKDEFLYELLYLCKGCHSRVHKKEHK